MEQAMAERDPPMTDVKPPARPGPAYSTFPDVAPHGPRDKRCFHGKPEDWQRAQARRTFGGKLSHL